MIKDWDWRLGKRIMYKPQLPRGDEIPRGESRSSWEGNLLETRDYLVV